MYTRNCSGKIQCIEGQVIPPDKRLSVPDQLPLAVAAEGERLRVMEIVIEKHDKGLHRDGQGLHILWRSPFSQGDGYATAAEQMVLSLLRAGVQVHPEHSWFLEDVGLDARTLSLLKERQGDIYQIGVCMATPGEFRKLQSPYRIGLTMYEADNPLMVHPEWRHDCQYVDRLVVPSAYCKEVFGAFYKGSIDIQPLAINPIYAASQRRKAKETFTFMCHATLTGRKAPRETVALFKRAFPRESYPDVRLEFKTRLGYFGFGANTILPVEDDRITVYDTAPRSPRPDWFASQIRDWLYRGDCFLYLSRGEGFGMTPREAMATGMPVIVANNTGMTEIAHEDVCYPIPTARREDCPLGGTWADPDWDHAVDTMRWVYEHRNEAYDKGEAGAKWFLGTHHPDLEGERLAQLLGNIRPSPGDRPVYEDVWARDPGLYKPLLDKLPQSTLIDFGCGSPELMRHLSKQGKRIIGLVSDDRYREVKKALGDLPIRLLSVNLFAFERQQSWPTFPSYSVGVYHRYGWEEARMLARKQMALGTPCFISAPAVYDTRRQAGGLWRKEQWEDLLRSFACELEYLDGNRAILAKITGEGHSVTAVTFGMVVDGVWRPRDATVKAEAKVHA